MKAGKFSTSIFQTASIPSSGYSSTSTWETQNDTREHRRERRGGKGRGSFQCPHVRSTTCVMDLSRVGTREFLGPCTLIPDGVLRTSNMNGKKASGMNMSIESLHVIRVSRFGRQWPGVRVGGGSVRVITSSIAKTSMNTPMRVLKR